MACPTHVRTCLCPTRVGHVHDGPKEVSVFPSLLALEGMVLPYSAGMASYLASGTTHMALGSLITPLWVVDSGVTNHVKGM